MFVRIVLVSVVVALAACPAYGQDEKLEWEKTFAGAMAKAKETGKRVFADFTSEVN